MNNPLVKRLLKQIESLNLRERILLTSTGVAICFVLVDFLVLTPVGQLQTQANLETTRWQGKLASLEVDAEKLGLAGNETNFLNKLAYAEQLKTEISTQDRAVTASLNSMIGPNQLPQVFADLLEKQGRLELDSLQSEVDSEFINLSHVQHPATEPSLLPQPAGGQSVDQSIEVQSLSDSAVRTNLTASYRGSYLSTRTFLNALADMPWALLWHQLEFTVTSYPDSTVDIGAYTLGSAP